MPARRPTPAPAAPPPAPLPLDVRLMNGAAFTVFALALLALGAAALGALARSPAFAIRAIVVGGEVERNSVATLRANVSSQLRGNFFSVDLQAARAAFEAVPWVRRAVVRRVWPDRLVVTLEEHRPVALWTADDRGDRLVNHHGEVFEANVGDVEDEELPGLRGPEGSASTVLTLHRRLQPVFAPLGTQVQALELSGRGSWRAELDNGAIVELGRGEADVLEARSRRFARTLPEVAGHYGRPLEYADLRHADGYAVRLRGVSTTVAPPPPTRTR